MLVLQVFLSVFYMFSHLFSFFVYCFFSHNVLNNFVVLGVAV